METTHSGNPPRVLVAGATGYLGKYVTREFKQRGYWVRVLTRSVECMEKPGPFTAPGIGCDEVDDVFVGEVTQPDTLEGVMDGIDIVYSSIGISRQRDGLSFAQVDYQGNRNLIDLCAQADVRKFIYVSMQGAENILNLAITDAHERVVKDLQASSTAYAIIRPCGFFSDMGMTLDMATVCVDAVEGDALEVEAGGPDIMTQRESALMAFEILGKEARLK